MASLNYKRFKRININFLDVRVQMNWEQNLTLSAVHNVQNLSSEWRTLIIHNLIGVAQLVIKGVQLKICCFPCIIIVKFKVKISNDYHIKWNIHIGVQSTLNHFLTPLQLLTEIKVASIPGRVFVKLYRF